MTESFLHYLWQNQFFDAQSFVTNEGIHVEVLMPGNYNTGAGPDFFNARVRIDETLWAGNVEIHINSSDWQKHNHHTDPAYDSCILHVVYNNDGDTCRMNGSLIPTIELAGHFPQHLWENYLQLIGTQSWIACEPHLNEINEVVWKRTIEEVIIDRMESRCQNILIAIKGNRDDWQETFYQHLARNFGFQINAVPFEMLARSLPGKILLKERTQLSRIESLLFGQAGMLKNSFTDEYSIQLFEEYGYLKNKYSLKAIPFSSWKFMRLRPVNFPTIRIAQLAALLYNSPVFFSNVVSAESLEDILEMFNVSTSVYWNTHYQFDKLSAPKIKNLGRDSIYNILINTCIPFIYSWGKFSGDKVVSNRAMDMLMAIPAEENHVIEKWRELGLKVHNAVDSQSLIQLKNLHCAEKKCLTCNIGKVLITKLPQ